MTPVSWYDASDDRDPADSVTVDGGLISMCGVDFLPKREVVTLQPLRLASSDRAAVNYNCGKLLHVGNASSSHAEYMELERTIRSVVWLRELMRAAQIFRLCTSTTINNNFGKISRLHNGTPVYADVTTGCFLKWLMWHDGTDYDGRWAVVTELEAGLTATASYRRWGGLLVVFCTGWLWLCVWSHCSWCWIFWTGSAGLRVRDWSRWHLLGQHGQYLGHLDSGGLGRRLLMEPGLPL